MLKDRKENIKILAHDFWCCINEIQKYLDMTICEECWTILSVTPTKIKIVNAELNEDENEEGQVPANHFQKSVCPNCKTENSHPAGMIEVRCSNCKKMFTVENIEGKGGES
jgi:LSD1 subclass zinc finger protein